MTARKLKNPAQHQGFPSINLVLLTTVSLKLKIIDFTEMRDHG